MQRAMLNDLVPLRPQIFKLLMEGESCGKSFAQQWLVPAAAACSGVIYLLEASPWSSFSSPFMGLGPSG
jgi:hypothetical protein